MLGFSIITYIILLRAQKSAPNIKLEALILQDISVNLIDKYQLY